MKLPKKPPNLETIRVSSKKLGSLMEVAAHFESAHPYLHWDKLCHMSMPDDVSPKELWFALKMMRRANRLKIPLVDTQGAPFSFIMGSLKHISASDLVGFEFQFLSP